MSKSSTSSNHRPGRALRLARAAVRLAALAGLALGQAACVLPSAEDDPTNIRISQLDSRLAKVERQVDNQGALNLMKQLDQLQKENQALRNDVETLQHEVQQAAARQKDQYLDIDKRLQALERSPAPAMAASGEERGAAAGAPPAGAGGDRAAYQAAFELLKANRFADAGAAFQQFLQAYPDSTLIDNAQYWYGESLYGSQAYDKALAAFQVVVDRYPQSRKIPDALLKIGFCDFELKRYDAARKALQSVVAGYPDTPAAKLARQRLDRMKAEGV